MKIIKKITGFFDESEEEIKEEIKEYKKKIKDAEKRLKNTKKNKKKDNNYIFIAICSILIITLLALVFLNQNNSQDEIKKSPETFNYECTTKNNCTECQIAINCLDIQEEENESTLWFTAENRYAKGNCNAIIKTGEKTNTMNLGILESNEVKDFAFKTKINYGKSNISIEPNCEWI